MTKDDLRSILERNKQISVDENQVSGLVSNSKPKSHQKAALGITVQGAVQSLERPIIRFVGYRIRPCDPDNFAASIKDLLDGLRHAKLISGDEPWKIILQTEQEKVRSKSQERTEIEIIYAPSCI